MRKSVLAILLLLSADVLCAPLEIEGGRGALFLEGPEGFRLHKDFLGLPYVLIDEGRERKSSVAIVPTGIGKMRLEDGLLQESYFQYEEGRRERAERKGHTVLSFMPFVSFANASGARVVSAGHRYARRDGTRNLERSWYVLCPREAFHVKLLTEDDGRGASLVERMRGSLEGSSCAGTSNPLLRLFGGRRPPPPLRPWPSSTRGPSARRSG